jgi:uncharacterized protein YdaU (DUF1376 family)
MANFPALPLFVDAYLADTRLLNCRESGAYLHLLMSAWLLPDGGLPNDDRNLATYARCTAREWQKVKSTVLQFWHTCDDGKLRQKRLEKERSVVQTRSEKSRQSANVRWERSTNGRQTVVERSSFGSNLDPSEEANLLKNNNVEHAFASAKHIHPTQPNLEEEREKDTSYPSLRARDEGFVDLFGAEKQAPPSAAERGSARTELADRPTSPPEASPRGRSRKAEEATSASPSPSEAVPQGKAELGGISESKKVPPRAARTGFDATVALPSGAVAGCGKPKRRSKPTPPSDTAESDEFWRAYPRRDDKYRFRFAFAEALKRTSAAELIAGAERYAATRAGEDPKWTKLAVNWLREERWLDEPAAARVIDQEGRPDMPHYANGSPRTNGHIRLSYADQKIARGQALCDQMRRARNG